MDSHNRSNSQLIVIAGPTGIGKTNVAIKVAKHWNTEVVSADSRQLFRELGTATAKPTTHELAAVTHHFISEFSIHEKFTAADYEKIALDRLNQLFREHRRVVCCGGTGLYLKALLEGLDETPDIDTENIVTLEEEVGERGLAFAAEELTIRDPKYASRVDLFNAHRVIRALAVCRQTNRSFSSFLKATPSPRPFRVVPICLVQDRVRLYQKINARVDVMITKGLIEEARMLYPHRSLRSLQTVGYQELFAHFDGEYDEQTSISLIKRNSRRYAKRQMTWFRNQGTWQYLDVEKPDLISHIITLTEDEN